LALAFEQAWRSGDADAVVAFFAEDCDISSEPPFAILESQRGTAGVRNFVAGALGKKIRLDLTRKQISGDRVSWRVRLPAGADGSAPRGLAEARFASGKIASFRLGPLR
jgi:ketosteroid isomerase-like protein